VEQKWQLDLFTLLFPRKSGLLGATLWWVPQIIITFFQAKYWHPPEKWVLKYPKHQCQQTRDLI
jgi:hypothetical protein